MWQHKRNIICIIFKNADSTFDISNEQETREKMACLVQNRPIRRVQPINVLNNMTYAHHKLLKHLHNLQVIFASFLPIGYDAVFYMYIHVITVKILQALEFCGRMNTLMTTSKTQNITYQVSIECTTGTLRMNLGTKMNFVGVKKRKQRKDLTEFLDTCKKC